MVHLAAAALVIDAHHVAIARTAFVALDAALVVAALGDDAAAEMGAGLDLDLGGVRQAFGGVRLDWTGREEDL